MVSHGVCVGDWGRFTTYVAPHALGPIVALSGQTSIADAYNTILNGVEWQEPDLLILQHDDLEITDPAAVEKLLAAAEEGVALIGVAGARDVADLAWWNYPAIGHQWIDSGLIDFGPRSGDVDALEGSLLAFTPWSIANLRFDPLPGFHGYDVGICRKARQAGRRVVVADVDTYHHTRVGFKTAESEAQWQAADQAFRGQLCG